MGIKHYIAAALVSLAIAGCSSEKKEEATLPDISFERADECHLCGMIIEGFPGPKGVATGKTDTHVRKFCSTRDLFSYYLDPENKRNVKFLLVHDMSESPWDSPDDEKFIEASNAWFVVGSSMKGAMGKTLASFSKENIATAFAKEHGGKVYRLDDITLDTINDF